MKAAFSILALGLLMFSIESFADCKKISDKCSSYALDSLKTHSYMNQCDLDEASFHVSNSDCRRFNPSKYIWYTATVNCGGDVKPLTKMVHHSGGKCY